MIERRPLWWSSVPTRLAKLEHQMLSWTGEGDSPDRVDALVHGLTLLFQPHHTVANPARPQGKGRWGSLRGL